jgi:hypothetical protein
MAGKRKWQRLPLKKNSNRVWSNAHTATNPNKDKPYIQTKAYNKFYPPAQIVRKRLGELELEVERNQHECTNKKSDQKPERHEGKLRIVYNVEWVFR